MTAHPEIHDHRSDNRLNSRFERRFGPSRRTRSVARIVATRHRDDRRESASVALAAESPGDVITVGNQPEGFGVRQIWSGAEEMAIVAFVNTSSAEGLMVSGVQDQDTFELISARGIASFSVEQENAGVPGLIGVVAIGADVIAGGFGQPELVPFINAAARYAQTQFPEGSHRGKRRDAFGQGTQGGRARQEGGVLITTPTAQTPFYSGDNDHDSRWIQGDGERVPRNYPAHLTPRSSAVFLRKAAGRQILSGTGDMFITAWDHEDAFADNFGFYELHFVLRRAAPRDTSTPIP
jgi:hypothetical protein